MIKVSAIIPVFNGSATLNHAIDSVLNQDSCGLELIVVDDGFHRLYAGSYQLLSRLHTADSAG